MADTAAPAAELDAVGSGEAPLEATAGRLPFTGATLIGLGALGATFLVLGGMLQFRRRRQA